MKKLFGILMMFSFATFALFMYGYYYDLQPAHETAD